MLKLYFLGSGPIAVPVLNVLSHSPKIELVGIGTQPDKPVGRKKVLTPTAVGQWCDDNNRKVDKISSVNTPEFLESLKNAGTEMIFVASFGQLLKTEILDFPSFGCINLHASLLPLYRGASPIAATLINGDVQTGITFMKMDPGLDTGPVYCRFEYEIPYGQKADELEDALGQLAGEHVEETLMKIAAGELTSVPQDHDSATHAGKINKQDGSLDWNVPAEKVVNMVRAYYPWPGVYFQLDIPGRKCRIRITEAELELDYSGKPGEVLKADKHEWVIACCKGAVSLNKVIPEGKKQMTGPEFLRGCPINPGTVL